VSVQGSEPLKALGQTGVAEEGGRPSGAGLGGCREQEGPHQVSQSVDLFVFQSGEGFL